MKKKLFKDHPLFKELHPKENKNTDFSRVYETSTKQVIWQCPKDKRHVYKQKIRSRTRDGYGCSYCSKYRTLPEESLASLYPNIAAEIHPDKNLGFDPTTRSPTSNKIVVWICKKGHEWKTRVEHRTRRKDAGCPTCRKNKNSLAFNNPDLLIEWHPSKNKNLNPWEVASGSNKKAWWVCINNPEHDDWERVIASRTKDDKGCPKCYIKYKKRKSQPLPILSEYSKEVTSQWHPTKNKGKLPSDYSAGSGQKIWWLCHSCKHEWPSSISNRARQKKGCPVCARLKKGKRTLKSGLSIVESHPDLALQWHKSLNKELKPISFTYGSAKKVWWQCPDKKEHFWEEKIINRTKRGSLDCKICEKEANSLQTVYPEIADEWHPTKNGDLQPSDVTKASGKIVWWQCLINPEHEWKADIRNRTINKSKCTDCSAERFKIHITNPNLDLDQEEVEIFYMYTVSINSMSSLLELSFHDNKRLIQPVYRMIYSSIITAIETYLSDAYQNKIINNSDRIAKVIVSSSELQKKKYSIEDILDWHKNIESKVIQFLEDIIWHKINKIRLLYKDTLGVTFPKNTIEIQKAVKIRHDLVHRNGGIKGGGAHSLTKENIEELIKNANKFVENIQKQLIKIE